MNSFWTVVHIHHVLWRSAPPHCVCVCVCVCVCGYCCHENTPTWALHSTGPPPCPAHWSWVITIFMTSCHCSEACHGSQLQCLLSLSLLPQARQCRPPERQAFALSSKALLAELLEAPPCSVNGHLPIPQPMESLCQSLWLCWADAPSMNLCCIVLGLHLIAWAGTPLASYPSGCNFSSGVFQSAGEL